MSSVLIVDLDADLGRELEALFRLARHSVTSLRRGNSVAAQLRANMPYDLVVIDVSRNDESALKQVEHVRQFREQYGPRPMLLCISSVYRGPRFELTLERKGARLVYVR